MSGKGAEMEQIPMVDTREPGPAWIAVDDHRQTAQPGNDVAAATSVVPDQAEGGWTAVGDADYDVIRKKRPDCAPTLFAVWYVLIREARFRRKLNFSLSDAIVADRACCVRRTAIKARRTLTELGLLRCWQKRSHELGNEPTEYSLKPSVSSVRGGKNQCETDAQSPCVIHKGASNAHTLRGQLDENTSSCPRKRARYKRPCDSGGHTSVSGLNEEKRETDAGPIDTTVPAFLKG